MYVIAVILEYHVIKSVINVAHALQTIVSAIRAGVESSARE